MADKTVNQLATLTSADFGTDDLLLVWDSTTGSTRKATIDTVATVSGTKGGFTFTGGFDKRVTPGLNSDPIYIGTDSTDKWVPFDFNLLIQREVDQPWWIGADNPNDIDLFGGSALPYGVNRMIDFTTNWDTSGYADVDDTPVNGAGTRTGTLRFDELDTGTTNLLRFDMHITPQIANTTVEVGLWFETRDAAENGNPTGAFPLPGSPLFFGTGTVGRQFLSRPTSTMYIASEQDQFAFAVPVVKSDNPIIIEPLSMLVQNLR